MTDDEVVKPVPTNDSCVCWLTTVLLVTVARPSLTVLVTVVRAEVAPLEFV